MCFSIAVQFWKIPCLTLFHVQNITLFMNLKYVETCIDIFVVNIYWSDVHKRKKLFINSQKYYLKFLSLFLTKKNNNTNFKNIGYSILNLTSYLSLIQLVTCKKTLLILDYWLDI